VILVGVRQKAEGRRQKAEGGRRKKYYNVFTSNFVPSNL